MTTIKELKEIIKDLPDDMLVLLDGGCHEYYKTYWTKGWAEKVNNGYLQSDTTDGTDFEVLLVEG